MRTSRFQSASQIVLRKQRESELSRTSRRGAPSVAGTLGLPLLSCSALGFSTTCVPASPVGSDSIATARR